MLSTLFSGLSIIYYLISSRCSMKRKFKKIKSKISYQNPWMRIEEHTLITSTNKELFYGFLCKTPGVILIALDSDGSIYFIREFRYPINKDIWQLPAGTLQEQSVLKQGKKELREETGIRAKNFKSLGGFYIAPGHENSFINVILATNLDTATLGVSLQDENENILQVKKIKISEVKKMIRKGSIKCGISLAALNIFFSQTN